MNIDNESAPPKDKLRRYATWGVVAGTAVWTTFFFGFLVIGALSPKIIPESWFLQMVREHPAGTLGVAMGAISAFSVVAVLDIFARDPIEIKFFQFELKGAAGPVVLWIVCFLAFVAGTELLWENQRTVSSSPALKGDVPRTARPSP